MRRLSTIGHFPRPIWPIFHYAIVHCPRKSGGSHSLITTITQRIFVTQSQIQES